MWLFFFLLLLNGHIYSVCEFLSISLYNFFCVSLLFVGNYCFGSICFDFFSSSVCYSSNDSYKMCIFNNKSPNWFQIEFFLGTFVFNERIWYSRPPPQNRHQKLRDCFFYLPEFSYSDGCAVFNIESTTFFLYNLLTTIFFLLRSFFRIFLDLLPCFLFFLLLFILFDSFFHIYD